MKCLVETSSCTSPPLTPPKKLHTQKTKHKITKTKHHNSPKQNKKNPTHPHSLLILVSQEEFTALRTEPKCRINVQQPTSSDPEMLEQHTALFLQLPTLSALICQ